MKTQPRALSLLKQQLLLDRIKTGMYQTEAAKMLGISNSSITRWREYNAQFATELDLANLVSAQRRRKQRVSNGK